MLSPAQAISRRAIAATVLVLLGLAFAATYRIVSGTEHQSFAAGALPPDSSHVTAAKTYQLSVPGGVTTLKARGANVASPECEWSDGGSASQSLTASAEGTGAKAVNTVATFVAPVTGDIRVDCIGWGAMYIDDADHAPADVAGWFLLLAVAALTVGAGVGVTALRMASEDVALSARRSAGEDDEIERLVHVVHVNSQDGEVLDADRGDVSP